jgi:hypothetical protein
LFWLLPDVQYPAVAGFHELPVFVQLVSVVSLLSLHEPGFHVNPEPAPSHLSFVSPETDCPWGLMHFALA